MSVVAHDSSRIVLFVLTESQNYLDRPPALKHSPDRAALRMNGPLARKFQRASTAERNISASFPDLGKTRALIQLSVKRTDAIEGTQPPGQRSQTDLGL
jgi:hypothetical protein